MKMTHKYLKMLNDFEQIQFVCGVNVSGTDFRFVFTVIELFADFVLYLRLLCTHARTHTHQLCDCQKLFTQTYGSTV